MRITLLEDAAGRKAGETFDLTNEVKAKALVDGGFAKAAPADPSPTEADLRAAATAAFKEVFAGAADAAKGARPVVIGDRLDAVPNELKGLEIFGTHGAFLHAVKSCGVGGSGGDRDSLEKLTAWDDMIRKCGLDRDGDVKAKAPSGNYESSDPDGGTLVLPEFSQKIVERMVDLENFVGDTDLVVVRGNTMTFPALDDKSRADGFRAGGVLGAWADEADLLATVSKARWRDLVLRLKKLYVFTYMTDELLADSPYALEQYVARKAAEEIAFKSNDALFRGNGGGQPEGFLNSKARITVAKETGQPAATIINANIEQMWKRFHAPLRKNAVWLINQETEYQLNTMGLIVGITGVPTNMPAGGATAPNNQTLKGRPVKVVEFAEALGTEGDISVVDWSSFQSIAKGGVKTDMSMHVRFQYGEMAYRFTYRLDSRCKWEAPLTPYKSTNTTSPIVTLATRS